MKKAKNYILYLLIILFGILSIIMSSQVSEEIFTAVERCLFVIIPSLFSFLVFSDLILKSGCYKFICKPFSLISKYIFKMDSNLFFVFLLGNICGYPIGLKLLNSLYEEGKINKLTAEIMSCYCYASGPSFVVGLVGITMFSSKTIGIVIFLANFLSNAVIAVVLNHIVKIPNINAPSYESSKVSIVDAVRNASKSLFLICSMIIMFASIIGILKGINMFESFDFCLPFLEITYIVNMPISTTDIIPFISALISFGGICVLFQLKALSDQISLKYLILSRVPAFFLSAAFTRIMIGIFDIDFVSKASQVFISGKAIGFTDSKSYFPAILMVIMMFILIFTKEKNPLKK